jgi:uncharacterized protein (TIGR02300 family)
MKAKRGTKRACQECAVPFYDLSRDPVVCPSCGARYVPAAPVAEEGRAAPFTNKTGWRGRTQRRPDPVPEPDAAADTGEAEHEPEEAIGSVPRDDVVLEEEPDEADVSGLFHHETDPKEG